MGLKSQAYCGVNYITPPLHAKTTNPNGVKDNNDNIIDN